MTEETKARAEELVDFVKRVEGELGITVLIENLKDFADDFKSNVTELVQAKSDLADVHKKMKEWEFEQKSQIANSEYMDGMKSKKEFSNQDARDAELALRKSSDPDFVDFAAEEKSIVGEVESRSLDVQIAEINMKTAKEQLSVLKTLVSSFSGSGGG